ncbi:NF-kappa-B inhibitor-interacting Ras-like protein 1 isoform X1 [Dermacentor andersoni]|uniref:NF-kappa-B inhibitor-interacting Ras-like protein 1 isoform X1 n=2 Tax=Dermacentor andersoni TaxID=34620 RepID=UPI0021550249|nr:NF-kappa-B inhibitor-interacting Ras-like protein 1 isoform X1 [Dermacentor andersoni]
MLSATKKRRGHGQKQTTMLKSSVSSGKTSKIMVCGHKGCGKTSVLEQLIYNHHPLKADIQPTIEDIYCALVDNDRGGKEKVQFFDSRGVDSSDAEVSKSHLAHADGVVLIYAINSRESFLLLEQLKKDIDKHKDKKELSFLVLGNKADLSAERQVETQSAINWATKERVRFAEVSAFDRKSLIEPFIYLVSKVNPPPSKSTFPQLGRKGKAGSITMEL